MDQGPGNQRTKGQLTTEPPGRGQRTTGAPSRSSNDRPSRAGALLAGSIFPKLLKVGISRRDFNNLVSRAQRYRLFPPPPGLNKIPQPAAVSRQGIENQKGVRESSYHAQKDVPGLGGSVHAPHCHCPEVPAAN